MCFFVKFFVQHSEFNSHLRRPFYKNGLLLSFNSGKQLCPLPGRNPPPWQPHGRSCRRWTASCHWCSTPRMWCSDGELTARQTSAAADRIAFVQAYTLSVDKQTSPICGKQPKTNDWHNLHSGLINKAVVTKFLKLATGKSQKVAL